MLFSFKFLDTLDGWEEGREVLFGLLNCTKISIQFLCADIAKYQLRCSNILLFKCHLISNCTNGCVQSWGCFVLPPNVRVQQ